MRAHTLCEPLVVARTAFVHDAIAVVVEFISTAFRRSVRGRRLTLSICSKRAIAANASGSVLVVARTAFVHGAVAVVVEPISAALRRSIAGGLNALALCVSLRASTYALFGSIVVAGTAFIHRAIAVVIEPISTAFNAVLRRFFADSLVVGGRVQTHAFRDAQVLAETIVVYFSVAVVVELIAARFDFTVG